MRLNLYLIVTFLLGALALGPLARAEDKPPLDAVVVMDSSGSMKKTDPRELRKPAGKLFINLLGDRDRLSVMSFSDNAYPITFLTPLDSDQNIQRALNATDRVSSKGVYTNIYAALARSIKILSNDQRAPRDPIVVLMSDGKMDLGDAQRNEALKQRIIDELLPQLKALGIKVYTIAFTDSSDQTLLQEIADATDGRYALAADDASLHKVFAQIFEQSKQPDMLPLTENEFIVDPSIREITIIANKKTEQSQIYLQTPDGERINSTFKSDRIKWFVSSSFDMITISNPQEGAWKILFSDDDNRAYIVADVKLRTLFEYNTQSYVPELTIKTWFEKDAEVIKQDELLASMEISLEIEHPDGQVENLPVESANEDGMFITLFKPTMDGIYAATVIARSKTFQRQQFFSFRAAIPKNPPPEPEPPAPPEAEAPSVEAPAEAPPAEVEPEPEPDDNFTRSLIIFVVVNLVIVFIGINVFLFMKMRKQKK